MLKLSRKKKNTWLALAVAASIMGGGTVFADETANYTDTLTGADYIDAAYADVIKDGVYTFTQDTQITHKQYGIELMENTKINAEGKTLTLNVNDVTGVPGTGIKIDDANTLSIKANTVKMNLTGTKVGSDGLQGVRITNGNAQLTVDGSMDITAKGDNNTIGIYNRGNVVVNGDVKLDIDGNNGGYQYYGATGLYATSSMKDSKGGNITVNGNVDFQGNANGLWANAGGAVVNVNGGSIVVKEGQTMGYAAIKAENGIVNMNVVRDSEGNVTGAGTNDVTIKGNLSLDTGAVNSNDKHGTKSEINLGLTTADSSLTGVVQNSFGDAGKKAGDLTFTGAANLWLQNGATWNNEVVDKIITNPYGGAKWAGSQVTNFVGGASEAKAGNIFQKDSNSLTINNYSGNTNIYYAHEGNGEAAENYKAGDTIIKHAAEGSVVSLITDNTGISMNSDANVANVLNALAGKLTYSNFVSGEKNLTGYVKIADGLTASSKAQKTGDITFTEEGKGSYVKPEVPSVKEYTNTLTGADYIDTAYADAIKDGVYTFTQDTQITHKQYGIELMENTKINAEGKTLTLNVNDVTGVPGTGIKIDDANTLSIKANTVKMNLTGTKVGSDGLQGVRITNGNAQLTVDGSMDITAKGDNNTIGIYNRGNVVVNGDVKLDIDGNNGGYQYYGATGLYATSSMKDSKGGNITVNGNVDFQGNANGLWANAGGAVVNVNGGSIVVKEGQTMGYAAIKAENGIVNMNVVRDSEGNVTGAGTNDVTIKGNLSLDTGAVNSNDKHGTKSEINLGLTTADSSLTGVVQNSFGDAGKKAGDLTFTGAANLWLQNGATWNNEVVDKIITNPYGGAKWAGSQVTNFVGGASEAKAGNIFQKDSNSLTINNYSGNTNIYYAHEGNGEAAENYKAGDTIIKHAAEGSVVSLITDNEGISMNSDANVANVLNALAGKLTYSNFASGEKNLTGYVKIADGLTASSKEMKSGDITFTENGKGSYVSQAPVVPSKTEFTTVLTGDTAADTEYAGNIKDGKYVFTANTTITAAGQTAVDIKAPLTIDAGNNQLVLMAKQGNTTSALPLFKQAVEGTTSIKADKLVIKNGTNDFNERSGMEVTKGNVDITADVDMKLSSMSNAYGIYVKANGSSVAIHGDLNLADSEQFDSINGLYVENTTDWGAKTSSITVDGKADINLHNGNAISAIRNGSTVTVGGGNIQVAKNDKNEFYALKSDGGVVNVNMNADKNAAGTATTVIKGNVSAYGEKANAAFDMDVTSSIINIGLSDKDSSWTGTAFAKDLGTSGFPFKGNVNLYLANGATWNNEAWGKTNAAFDGSHVAKLAGGASEAKAGNIFQKDSRNLTIDSYSGNTNIFYAHEGNGEATENYKAGDTIITSAAAGSVVNLITDNTGIKTDNDVSVANALNALAGKLTYSNFVTGENKLAGYVKIADGLTSSSHTLKSDTIKFNKDTGKGYTKEEVVGPEPGEGDKTTFKDAITGEKQGVYNAVQQEDLSYVFTEDASITINQMTNKVADPDWEGSYLVSGAAVQNAADVKNLVIKAEDKTLKLKLALDKETEPPDPNAGILNNRIPLRGIDNSVAGSATDITVGTLDIDIDNTYNRKTGSGNPLIGEGSVAGIYANSTGEKASVTVKGNTVIKAHGYNNVYGVNANGNSEIKLNGDLTMAKDGDKWAIENVINGKNTTALGESAWRNIAGINAKGAGANVTVDGKTTIAAHGSGVVAADGATVNLGAANIEVKNNSDEAGYAFHAVGAALGTINVGGEGKTVTVKGNAGIFGKQGQEFASDSKESVVNLKLTTEDSSWTGVAYKYFTDAEKEAGLNGSLNLTLANGASWTNEKYGYVYGDSEWEKYKFSGSEIANFVGGASDAKAGNIFQKDSNSLTINSYSGNTNIYYAHEGNGEATENYKAGDTIIKHAEKDSVVSLITDNTGISMDSDASVAKALNALAGKLTYSNFVTGEKNLTGFVKIADGLTASSAAIKTGNIAFNAEDGKGSLKNEEVKPEPPTPEPPKPEPSVPDKFDQGITGDGKDDQFNGVVKEDGSYEFNKDTEIKVETGSAVSSTNKDVNISTSDKLTLAGKDAGISAAGKDVNIKGNTEISGEIAIKATIGNITLNGGTTITGTDAAINAGKDITTGVKSSVTIKGENKGISSAVTITGDIKAEGGNITIDSSKATGIINGDVTASNGGSVEISLNGNHSKLTGGFEIIAGSIKVNLNNGATWNLTGAEGEGLTINGGATEAAAGVIVFDKDYASGAATYSFRTPLAPGVTAANYSGWTKVFYSHNDKGYDVGDYIGGDITIQHAAVGSGVILSTDNSGNIDMNSKSDVEKVLSALAQKLTYTDSAANGDNLTGKVQIVGGLTASGKSKEITGSMKWDETTGKGEYVLDSSNQILEGDYETFVMKGVRSAATTSMHTWRDNMQDTYTGADMADEDGMFAKALGGKTSSDVSGLKDSNSYYGVQVGYDKALAYGWHTGIAFDYRDGDSNYLLGGKGDNQMYSFGVYGVKNFDNNAFFRVAAKVGRVENEYDVYNEIRSLKLHGDYKSNAYGLTMEVGKTFGTEETYFTPKAQLTWSQVGAKDYTASTGKAEMQIEQDSYSSFVGRMGFEAGIKSAKGRVYAGLFAAHEFNGDISANYFANDGNGKHTSFNGEDTWMEMKLGGTYDFSKSAHLYADIAKDFGGDFERKWKLNAGLRFEF